MASFLWFMSLPLSSRSSWIDRPEGVSVYCLVRGPLLLCTTNTDDQQSRTLQKLPFAGMKVCNAFNPSNCMDGAETMHITIPAGGKPLLLVGK